MTMARDDIIRLAREAGASPLLGGETALFGDAAIERFAELVIEHDRETWMGGPAMRQFADLVAAAEREACADIASTCCEGCADDIRARGQ